jgi:hypothetical protein
MITMFKMAFVGGSLKEIKIFIEKKVCHTFGTNNFAIALFASKNLS